MKPAASTADSLSVVLVSLFRGVVYNDRDPEIWQAMLTLQARIRDYVAFVGLDLMLDEAEGFAFLKQRPVIGDTSPLPRLVPRRQLGFGVSLLLALLRKKLAEFDAAGGDSRLIITRDSLVDAMKFFAADSPNEAKIADRIDGHINRAVELGFLRPLEGRSETYEVRRILKAFVDAQWLQSFNDRLTEYRQHLGVVDPGSAAVE